MNINLRALLHQDQMAVNEAIAAQHRLILHEGNSVAYDLSLRGLRHELTLVENQLA
ncbi:MAG: hypothetical protein Q7U16_04895 [Agitococcus sp.]|nr:hypothetical protein [Agitococcus sp.]